MVKMRLLNGRATIRPIDKKAEHFGKIPRAAAGIKIPVFGPTIKPVLFAPVGFDDFQRVAFHARVLQANFQGPTGVVDGCYLDARAVLPIPVASRREPIHKFLQFTHLDDSC